MSYPQLGQTSASGQIASTVASTGARALATFIPAVSSYAGPIGMIVGGIVSLLMSLFSGPKKKPVFGLIVIIPEADDGVLRVGRMLDLLRKPAFDATSWNWGIKDRATMLRNGAAVKALLDQSPQGALAITSGGLPSAHTVIQKMDFSALLQQTSALAKPFVDSLNAVTDRVIKESILNTALPYKASKSYYFQIGEAHGERAGTDTSKSNNEWVITNIAQNYDALKISGGEAIGGTLRRAWESIPEKINEAFIVHAGVDIMKGLVLDPLKAEKAFKPTVESTVQKLVSTPVGWLILIGGFLVLNK